MMRDPAEEQIHTIFGVIIKGVKDRMDEQDEILLARIEWHRAAIIRNHRNRKERRLAA